jgi:hypothetical protein
MNGIERTETTNKNGKVTITTKYIVKKDGSSVAIVRRKPPTTPHSGSPTSIEPPSEVGDQRPQPLLPVLRCLLCAKALWRHGSKPDSDTQRCREVH